MAAAILAAAGACHDVTRPQLPPPGIEAVTVIMSAGTPTLHVELESPAPVDVVYWEDPAHPLRVRTAAADTAHDVQLLRTHFGRTVAYEVHAIGSDGGEGQGVSGQIRTPSLPDDLAAVSLAAHGSLSVPLVLLEVNGAFKGFVIVDGSGEVVWYRRTEGAAQGSTVRANGNFVLNDAGHALYEVTPGGAVVHSLDMGSRSVIVHHDVIATPRNSLLFIATESGSAHGQSLTGDAIWEWTPETGQLVKRWSAFDWFDPAVDWGIRSYAADWLHTNSLALGPHGNIIVSCNWLDQVISIAPDWGHIEWKLGGARGDFAVDSASLFIGQHTAQLLSATRVLLFDNGRDRPDGAKYSRALELVLDTLAKSAHQTWEFRPSPDIFAPYVGAARRLPNGNTLVQFGFGAGQQGSTGPIETFEVRPDGSVAWTLTIGGVTTVYRATPLLHIGDEETVP
jgi:hypothetical protein